jgi:hypothetical protein
MPETDQDIRIAVSEKVGCLKKCGVWVCGGCKEFNDEMKKQMIITTGEKMTDTEKYYVLKVDEPYECPNLYEFDTLKEATKCAENVIKYVGDPIIIKGVMISPEKYVVNSNNVIW